MKARNFNEIYEQVARQKDSTLDNLQKRKKISGASILILIILFFFTSRFLFKNYTIVVIYTIITIFDVVIFIITSSKYNSFYKQTVIKNLVSAYSPDLSFCNKPGISEMEYNRAGYNEYHNRFFSEDLIQGNVDNEFFIKMSEVEVQKEETYINSEGKTETETTTIFRGLFGFVDIKNKMIPDFEISTNNFFGKYSKSRIEVDSSNFEKYYDLYTPDKVRTMEIFTSDLIELFNTVKDELNSPIQVKVFHGILYFRISMKNSFEAPTFGKTLDFNAMEQNFKLIDRPIRLVSKILENAENVQY